MRSKLNTLALISSAALLCCSSAAEIRCSISSVSRDDISIRAMSSLTSFTVATALAVSVTACCTNWAISCELSALLAASLPTSSATTEKPLPCSPARAASMAAFRDSKLVLLAIFSITSVILLILSELTAMLFTTSTMSVIFCMPMRMMAIDSCDFWLATLVLRDTSPTEVAVWRTAAAT